MLTKRAQILFDETMWSTLTAAAKKQKISVGKLVRNAVEKQYEQNVITEQRKKAVDAILAWRKKYGKKYAKGPDSVTLIRKMRNERYGKAHLRRLSSY